MGSKPKPRLSAAERREIEQLEWWQRTLRTIYIPRETPPKPVPAAPPER